jgi:hypothetical protein
MAKGRAFSHSQSCSNPLNAVKGHLKPASEAILGRRQAKEEFPPECLATSLDVTGIRTKQLGLSHDCHAAEANGQFVPA